MVTVQSSACQRWCIGVARNTLKLELSGFKELLARLDKLGGDVHEVVEDALTQAAGTIASDTLAALADANLPAGGKYSRGDTKASVVTKPRVTWEGTTASVGVGFDYDKPGAGGLLITGTPKMKPDYALQKMYKKKGYMQKIQNNMGKTVTDAISKRMG